MELLLLAVLLTRAGMAAHAAGLSRAKNSAGAAARAACDLGVAALAFYLVGAGLVGQERNPYLGFGVDHWFGADPRAYARALLYLLYTVLATGIVQGPAGERTRFWALVPVTAVLAGAAVPLLGFWVGRGWLGQGGLGFVDAAGGCWVHAAGGAAALVVAWRVGPRQNKYNRDGSANAIPGHSAPLAGLGAMLTTAGLVTATAIFAGPAGGDPFAGPRIALAVVLAAAAGAVAALVLGQVRYGKPDVGLALAGLLGGAVAIAAPAASVFPVWAIVIGAAAGALVPLASVWLDLRLRVDDPTGGVAVHLVGGAWGTVAAALFAGGGVGHTLRQLGVQLLGLTVCVALAGGATLLALALAGRRRGVRASEADEFDGLDLAEHDVGAYPDFQQNSIRSYHLREA